MNPDTVAPAAPKVVTPVAVGFTTKAAEQAANSMMNKEFPSERAAIKQSSITSLSALTKLLDEETKSYTDYENFMAIMFSGCELVHQRLRGVAAITDEQRNKFYNLLDKYGYTTPEQKLEIGNYLAYYHQTQFSFDTLFNIVKEPDVKELAPYKMVNLGAVKRLVSAVRANLEIPANRIKFAVRLNEALLNVGRVVMRSTTVKDKNPLFDSFITSMLNVCTPSTVSDYVIRHNGAAGVDFSSAAKAFFINADETTGSISYYNGAKQVELDVNMLFEPIFNNLTRDLSLGVSKMWLDIQFGPSVPAELRPNNNRTEVRVAILTNLVRFLLFTEFFLNKNVKVYTSLAGLLKDIKQDAWVTDGSKVNNAPGLMSRPHYFFMDFVRFDERIGYFMNISGRDSYLPAVRTYTNRLKVGYNFPFLATRDRDGSYTSFDVKRKCLVRTTRQYSHGYHASKGQRTYFLSNEGLTERADTNQLYMGIELELAGKSVLMQTDANSRTMATCLMVNSPVFNLLVSAERDGSIQPCGNEFVFKPMTPQVAAIAVTALMSHPFIRMNYAANESCGNHIHVSKSFFKTPMAFAKWFRFMGGDVSNRRCVEYFAQRGSNNYNRSGYDKSINTGLFYFTGRSCLSQFRNSELTNRYSAVNMETGLPTYEVRIFAGTKTIEEALKNIEFAWASIRFATWVNRNYLAGNDFMQWLQRHPKDFPNLISWLFTQTKTDSLEAATAKLRSSGVLSSVIQDNPVQEADVDEEQRTIDSLVKELSGRVPDGIDEDRFEDVSMDDDYDPDNDD